MMIGITMGHVPDIALPEDYRNGCNYSAHGGLAETTTKKTLRYPRHKERDSRGSQEVGGDGQDPTRRRKQGLIAPCLDNQKRRRNEGKREISIKHVGRSDETADRERRDRREEQSYPGRKELARQDIGHQQKE